MKEKITQLEKEILEKIKEFNKDSDLYVKGVDLIYIDSNLSLELKNIVRVKVFITS